MKIQLASDLHLEFLARDFPGERLITPVPDADVLALTGDIASGTQAIELFKDWPVPVLYVAGNHEFYGRWIDKTLAELRAAAEGTSVRFMDNDVVDFGGVRFLGSTLWTDYKLNPGTRIKQQMEICARYLTDHRTIRSGTGYFTPNQALEEHKKSRAWLMEQLSTPYDGKTVVLSHHGPHRKSVHPKYARELANAGFCSNLEELLAKADVWMHGHVHDTFDYEEQGCRVLANPRGYALNHRNTNRVEWLQFENKGFIPNLMVDV